MTHIHAEREALFLQLWERIKPSEDTVLRVTEPSLKSLLHDAYITGWLDAEIHADENESAA